MSDRFDAVAPSSNPETVAPVAEDEPYRQAVADALAAWVDARIARGGPGLPAVRLQVVESVAKQVEDMLTAERRRAALFALGAGTSAAAVNYLLGLSRWAVGKRWPDLAHQARPLRWLSANQADWCAALAELVDVERSASHRRSDDVRRALTRLRALVDAYQSTAGHWWLLLETPELARAVLDAPAPPRADVQHHVVRDWLAAQLADYDLTRAGQKHVPRSKVSRSAVQAATEARLDASAGD